MLEIAIMIEGQNGLTWQRWQKIARLVEETRFAGLFRSDHFTNPNPPDIASLELWTSLTWLAGNTQRIEFGPLVTPFSFRHPVFTARMASAVDDLSQGRLVLGLGAGWQEREHRLFGFDLLEPAERFDRFEEGLEVVTRLLQSDEPVTFEGRYYQLRAWLAAEVGTLRGWRARLPDYVSFAPGAEERFAEVVGRGKGLVFTTGHVGNWELLAQRIAMRWPSAVIARTGNDPGMTALVGRLRAEGNVETLWREDPSAARAMNDSRSACSPVSNFAST